MRLPGVTAHPISAWAVQAARELADELEDADHRLSFLIGDGNATFTAAIDAVFELAPL
ncbi:hypothetical protein GCM10023205_67450 [Yinghuangia aomiensis]|uniref:Uncharacterized protein n=1 Tax=Yinghuangia aomiensis TaxID=676205 RepID=A0ABP9I3R0_9ACTN